MTYRNMWHEILAHCMARVYLRLAVVLIVVAIAYKFT